MAKESPFGSSRLVVQDFDRLTPEQNALMSGFVALITAAACNLHTARALTDYTPVGTTASGDQFKWS